MSKLPTLLKCAFHDDVRIVPYQAEWPRRFRLTKQLIIALLLEDDMECYVRHVGGSAIPGMCGKPIVDVLVLVEPEELETAKKRLATTFLCLGECGRTGRWFFSDGDSEDDATYIHLTTQDHPVARDQLAFLRLVQGSETLRDEYTALKKRLAEKYPHDRLGYRLEKGVFIERCLRENTAENS